jgi:hypothetical protein
MDWSVLVFGLQGNFIAGKLCRFISVKRKVVRLGFAAYFPAETRFIGVSPKKVHLCPGRMLEWTPGRRSCRESPPPRSHPDCRATAAESLSAELSEED